MATRRSTKRRALEPRRAPVQDRSRERVARVIDAAASLLDDAGLEAVTTNAIARKARLPVGTVYQFFPNRDAILMALARARLAELDARFRPFLDTAEQGPRADAIGHVIDTLRSAYVEIPGLATLVASTQGHPELEAVYAENNRTIVGWCAAVLAARAPALGRADATAAATVVVEASDAVIRHWLRARARGERGNARLFEQLKTMLRAYLGALDGLPRT